MAGLSALPLQEGTPLKTFQGPSPGSHGQNLALTVLHVPYLLERQRCWAYLGAVGWRWRGEARRFGFRVSGFGLRVSGFGFRVSGFGFRDSGLGVRGLGSVLWVSSFGFAVSGFGFRVSGFEFQISPETQGRNPANFA